MEASVSDVEVKRQALAALEKQLETFEADEKFFIKAKGIDETIADSLKEKGNKESELETVKDELKNLQAKKARALQSTAEAIALKMGEVLPTGRAIFNISDEGKVWIGWERPDGIKVPYKGINKGNKAPFDQALCHALLGPGPKTLVQEAAEMDGPRLLEAMQKFSELPDEIQVILCTWFKPETVPAGWNVEVIQ